MAEVFSDEDFNKYLRDLSKLAKKENGYVTKMATITGHITAFAGMESERAYTETQLKKIFELAWMK